MASKHCMDPSFGISSFTLPSQRLHHGHPPRTNSMQAVHGHPEPNVGRSGGLLRREHSDSDLLENIADSRSRISSDKATAAMERESWMRLMRNPSSGRQDSASRAQLAANRVAMIAADRRKRLSEHSEGQSGRRTSSSLSFVPPSGRSRQNSIMDMRDRPFVEAPPPPGGNNSSTQRIADRPLPRRSSIDTSRDRRSCEITLPRWEPDIEVPKCPICKTAFSFWYRKHHCRKCGRVVCANCSPHRITIPRQFIVHPPEEAPQSPTDPVNTGVDLVDLTGDSEADDGLPPPDARPQSSDYRIDPALGGGQEVRLCNPCVPDPNPLPHLPFCPSGVQPPGPFPRPDRISSLDNRPSVPSLTASDDCQQPGLMRRFSSGRSEYRHGHPPRFDGSAFQPMALPGLNTNTSTSVRHSHAPRLAESPLTPPGYSTIFGSAPNQTAHQVRFQLFMTCSVLTDEAPSFITVTGSCRLPSPSATCLCGNYSILFSTSPDT